MSIEGITQFKTSSTPAIVTTVADIAANADRRYIFIQNLSGANHLFFYLGDTCSTTLFTGVLKKGSASDDGNGGTFVMEGAAVYTGIISFAGTTPRYTVSTDA